VVLEGLEGEGLVIRVASASYDPEASLQRSISGVWAMDSGLISDQLVRDAGPQTQYLLPPGRVSKR